MRDGVPARGTGDGETQGGGDRRYHQGRRRTVGVILCGGQGRQGGKTLVAGASIDGEALEGENFGFGQQEHGGIVAEVGEKLVVETAGVVQAGRDDYDGPLLKLPKGGQVDGLVVGMDGKGGPSAGRVEIAEMALQPGLSAEEGDESS